MWCFLDGIIKYHIEGLENKIGKLNAKSFAFQLWLGVSTLNKRLFTTNQRRFLLALFVRIHKFLFGEIRLSSFFKRVTSYFSTKPGSVETNSTLVVEVSNVNLQSI